MITTAKEYYENLFRIQDQNPPSLAVLLPSSEKIYEVDLTTRIAEAPDYLGVSLDHRSEVIYFVVDRYFDYMDLAETVCLIYYTNANKESHYYPVPFYDLITCSTVDEETGEQKYRILFPWCIDSEAMKKAGKIEFAINFYKLDKDGQEIIYNISTRPATSKVLTGMNDNKDWNPSGFSIPADDYKILYEKLKHIEDAYAAGLYWLTVNEIK